METAASVLKQTWKLNHLVTLTYNDNHKF